MDKKFLEEAKNSLLQERKRLEEELGNIAQKNKKIKDDYQAKYLEIGNKEEENAQEVTLYENRLSLERDLEKILKEVGEALEMIKQGNYGICKKCKQIIPEARLKALPQATLCLKCKKEKNN
ncbi:MAG: DnaK suppressor protein [Parcubacteria group bacterium Athens1014_10]|nr:MAG: DnaK suppressor protein [Parcubacteria group bacterium Athens1014_10]TSD05910.1 MAG: DnaK suppressor protein [Parcubacteria group bacterium Athens0714_12]